MAAVGAFPAYWGDEDGDDAVSHWRDTSQGWILVYEEAVLCALASTLRDGARVVNIGAGAGTSACAILRGLSDLDHAQLISVDLDEAMTTREREAVDTQAIDPDRLEQIIGDSAQVGREWTGSPIDLLFVDGSHSYEGVSADLAAWTPHMAPGAVLACHDYGDLRQEALTRAIDDWRERHPWREVARALFLVAFLAPGGDEEWTKGRLI